MVNVGNPTCVFDEKSFNEFCSLNKVIFPESFVNYLREHNDGELDPNAVCLGNNECIVRYFYGITTESYSDIREVYNWYSSRVPHKCFPIADPDFGNQICISLEENTYGKIYFWDHETMDTDEDEICTLRNEDMILLAESFEELLKKIEVSPYCEKQDCCCNHRTHPHFLPEFLLKKRNTSRHRGKLFSFRSRRER